LIFRAAGAYYFKCGEGKQSIASFMLLSINGIAVKKEHYLRLLVCTLFDWA
jgi:hypothetical protein